MAAAAPGTEPRPGSRHLVDVDVATSWLQAFCRARVHGSTDPQLLVQGWCSAVLERRAGPSERAHWAARIDRDGRLGVLRDVWCSDGAVRERIDLHYRALSDR